jgi:ubiquinone/menaquinone biosynthesis C-methylase UbiE
MEIEMSSRGEQDFITFPKIAAKLYGYMMAARPMKLQYREIAQDLCTSIDHGRLLDIGTGPGHLLLEIHLLNSDIELFGLDVSSSMVDLARMNLKSISAEIHQGSIEATDFPGDSFEAVICSGSFYLWDHPIACLNEIHRILKPGGNAYLYESFRDHDEKQLKRLIRKNLKEENLIRRTFSPIFLMKQLRMAYSEDEIRKILDGTSFSKSYSLERMVIAGLPIWLRIGLQK